MLRYIGRRLLQTIPVFFGATFLIFAMVYLMPGDPVAALGGDRGLSESAAAQIRAQYNLDKPFWMQYLLYLKGVFTLDFGKAFNGQPVIDLIAGAFPITIRLALYAMAIETILGITLGVIAGVKRGGWFDSTVLVLSRPSSPCPPSSSASSSSSSWASNWAGCPQPPRTPSHSSP